MDFVLPIHLEDLVNKSSDDARYVVKHPLEFDKLDKDAIDKRIDGLCLCNN